jgi:glycosyltransferase involved in cell wall biosynthesis
METQGIVATVVRYVISFAQTLHLLFREKPSLVFVVNQPVLLPLAAYIYGQVSGRPFVIDHHSGAFTHRKIRFTVPLLRLLCRGAALSFATNSHHQGILEGWGARARLLADVPFEFESAGGRGHPGTAASDPRMDGPLVVMVSTFSRDEPLVEVLEAARQLPRVRFSVTGSLTRAHKSILVRAPLNVTFTDFLPDPEYLALLGRADAVLALTTRDHTLQRGAYEALALGRPVVTSSWPLLREVFCRGAVHTDNDADSIARAIASALSHRDELAREALQLRERRRRSFARLTRSVESELRREELLVPGVVA